RKADRLVHSQCGEPDVHPVQEREKVNQNQEGHDSSRDFRYYALFQRHLWFHLKDFLMSFACYVALLGGPAAPRPPDKGRFGSRENFLIERVRHLTAGLARPRRSRWSLVPLRRWRSAPPRLTYPRP